MLVSKYFRSCGLAQFPSPFDALHVDFDKVEEWNKDPTSEDKDFREPWMGYARSLSCTIGIEATEATYNHYRQFFNGLNRFKKPTSLRLTSVHLLDSRITIPQVNVQVFTLENCNVKFGVFAALVKNLPKLTHLKLIGVSTSEYNPLPCLPPSSLRKLSVVNPLHWSVDIIKMFIPTPWEEVSISWGCGTVHQAFINGVSGKVTSLDLQGDPSSTYRDASYMGILNIIYHSF